MNDLGGYAPQLDFAIGASMGQSALLPETCVGAITGNSNPDGQCVLGGRLTRAGTCDATPIFVQNMVPYTTGTVSGVQYNTLKNLKSYTRLNQGALLQNMRRVS